MLSGTLINKFKQSKYTDNSGIKTPLSDVTVELLEFNKKNNQAPEKVHVRSKIDYLSRRLRQAEYTRSLSNSELNSFDFNGKYTALLSFIQSQEDLDPLVLEFFESVMRTFQVRITSMKNVNHIIQLTKYKQNIYRRYLLELNSNISQEESIIGDLKS